MPNNQTGVLTNPYPEVVYKSFLENSVRSALLIDDQFPMFDTSDDELTQYNQADRAKRLYRTFRDRQIICDIESRPSALSKPSDTERLLKSDLVVLDYHLTKGDKNPEKALAILRSLAESRHFNVVALYTNSDNLEKVWIEVTATLRGGWGKPEALLSDRLIEVWNELEDSEKMPDPNKELLISCLENGVTAAVRTPAKQLRAAFENEGVEKKDCSELILARISQEFREKILANGTYDETSCKLVSGSCKDPYWVQSGNLFVAILKKLDPGEGEEQQPDPEKIWERLTASIQAWQPNLLQIMLSEIQNTLEVEGVTIDPHYAGSPELQAGILFALFNNFPAGEASSLEYLLRPAIEDFTWKIVESIRRKICTNSRLIAVADQLVKYETSKDDWGKLNVEPRKRTKDLLKFVKEHLVRANSLKDESLLFELNSFLSVDVFRGSHLTTGTIFKIKRGEEDYWWMCCSPACDMVPRAPTEENSKRKSWQTENHPMKKMVALRLDPVNPPTKGLQNAHNGQRIFIIDHEENKYQFKVLDENNHPNWEILLLDESGKVNFSGGASATGKFQACFIQNEKCESQVVPHGDCSRQVVAERIVSRKYCSRRAQRRGGLRRARWSIRHSHGASRRVAHREQNSDQGNSVTCKIEAKTFCVVAQLRPEYANRILQFTGHYLSRIGVDFLSLPK